MAYSPVRLDLLAPLMEGAFEEPLWSTFLDRLRARTGADYASMIFRPPGMPLNEVIHLFSGERSPPQVQLHYHEILYKTDPLPYHQLTEGRVYALGELLARDTALLESLGPYVRGALRSFVALERERFAASVAGDAIRRLNFGWFTLDAAVSRIWSASS